MSFSFKLNAWWKLASTYYVCRFDTNALLPMSPFILSTPILIPCPFVYRLYLSLVDFYLKVYAHFIWWQVFGNSQKWYPSFLLSFGGTLQVDMHYFCFGQHVSKCFYSGPAAVQKYQVFPSLMSLGYIFTCVYLTAMWDEWYYRVSALSFRKNTLFWNLSL